MSVGKDLAARIHWVLSEKKMSRRAWSLKAGLAHSQVTMMLTRIDDAEAKGEEASFEKPTLTALAVAAGVSPSWFIFGAGEPDGASGSAYERAREMFLEGADDPARASAWLAEVSWRMPTDATSRLWLTVLEDGYLRFRNASALPPKATHEARAKTLGGPGSKVESDKEIATRGPRKLSPAKRRSKK